MQRSPARRMKPSREVSSSRTHHAVSTSWSARVAALFALCLCLTPSHLFAQDSSDAAAEAKAAIEAAEEALPPRKVEVDDAALTDAPAEEEDAAAPVVKDAVKPEAPEPAPTPEPEPEPAPAVEEEEEAEEVEVQQPETSVLDEETPERAALPGVEELLAPEKVAESEPPEEEVEADAARHASAPENEAPEPAKEQEEFSPQPASFVTLEVVRHLFDDVKGLDLRRHHDLTLYVDSPEWFQALALMEEGECKKALTIATPALPEVADGEEHPRAIQYAVAKMQLCAGKKKEAGVTLRQLAKGKDSVARLAGRTLGLKVKEPVSEEEVGEVRTLEQKLSAAARQAKDPEKLEETLAQLSEWRLATSSGWAWYRVRLTEAEILERADMIEDARGVWYTIYLRTRDWRSGAKIEQMVEAFEKRQKVQVIGVAERVDRMRELISRGRYKDARKVSVENAKFAGIKSSEKKGWGYYRQGLEAERKKKRDDAIALFEKADKLIEHEDVRPRLYFGWARALRRVDRDPEAIALYDKLCLEHPNSMLCPDALYEAGRLLQYQNKHDDARTRFHTLVTLHPFHRDVADALWRAAFSAYLQKKWDMARAPLEHIIAHHGDRRDASELTMALKAQYWLGVVELKRGDRDLARQELQKTINMGSLTWYGRLAAARLEEMGINPLIPLPASRLSIDDLGRLDRVALPHHPRLEEAVELIRIGFYKDAISEVARQLTKHPRPDGIERLMANLQLVVGRPDLAHWTMKSHISQSGPTPRDIRDWGTAFPLQYMESAYQWGVKYGVDPFLVQAIIRQESGFRPTVKSYAGAVGLMQLMPGTARYTARVFLEEDGASYRRRDLLEPAKNIRLGTMYIRVHTAHAVDNVALALAGYNAGPAPLQRWIKQYGDRELDAFVESITYREARGYVRKVMTSYITYSGLYGDGQLPSLTMKVPTSLRKWGDVPEVERLEEGAKVSLAPTGHKGREEGVL